MDTTRSRLAWFYSPLESVSSPSSTWHPFELTQDLLGSLLGSVLGGRYSDHVFRKLKARKGGASQAEVRSLVSFVSDKSSHKLFRCD